MQAVCTRVRSKHPLLSTHIFSFSITWVLQPQIHEPQTRLRLEAISHLRVTPRAAPLGPATNPPQHPRSPRSELPWGRRGRQERRGPTRPMPALQGLEQPLYRAYNPKTARNRSNVGESCCKNKRQCAAVRSWLRISGADPRLRGRRRGLQTSEKGEPSPA